jgi:hypothetical protein
MRERPVVVDPGSAPWRGGGSLQRGGRGGHQAPAAAWWWVRESSYAECRAGADACVAVTRRAWWHDNTPGRNHAYGQLVVPLILSGTGIAVAIPAIQSIVIGSVAPHHVGKASETLSTLRQLGGVFGVAVVAAVFTGTGSYAPAQAFSDGFHPLVHFRVTPRPRAGLACWRPNQPRGRCCRARRRRSRRAADSGSGERDRGMSPVAWR